MARQYLIPGTGYVNETGTNDYLIPESIYINETVSSSPPPSPTLRTKRGIIGPGITR